MEPRSRQPAATCETYARHALHSLLLAHQGTTLFPFDPSAAAPVVADDSIDVVVMDDAMAINMTSLTGGTINSERKHMIKTCAMSCPWGRTIILLLNIPSSPFAFRVFPPAVLHR